jgi:hypothetical protein
VLENGGRVVVQPRPVAEAARRVAFVRMRRSIAVAGAPRCHPASYQAIWRTSISTAFPVSTRAQSALLRRVPST